MAAEAKGGKPSAGRITRPPGTVRRGPDGTVHGAPGALARSLAQPAVLRLTSEPAEEEEREPLFYIDDAEYTIPVEPSGTIGLTALHIIAGGGGSMAAQMVAQDYIMTELLGEEGYRALRTCKSLKARDLQRLIEVCSQKTVGALEDPNP